MPEARLRLGTMARRGTHTRFSRALTAATFGLLVAAPVALAGAPAELKVAKQKDGPYKTVLKANVANGEAEDLFFRATSRADKGIEGDFAADAAAVPSGWKVTYFRGDNDITDEASDGYEFGLAPGQRKFFHARVKRKTAGADPFCLETFVIVGPFFEGAFAGINGKCEP